MCFLLFPCGISNFMLVFRRVGVHVLSSWDPLKPRRSSLRKTWKQIQQCESPVKTNVIMVLQPTLKKKHRLLVLCGLYMPETINDKQSNKMCFEAFLKHLTYLLLNFHVKIRIIGNICFFTTFAFAYPPQFSGHFWGVDVSLTFTGPHENRSSERKKGPGVWSESTGLPPRIHGTANIFCWFCMVNVGKYTSPMDGMGRSKSIQKIWERYGKVSNSKFDEWWRLQARKKDAKWGMTIVVHWNLRKSKGNLRVPLPQS